MDFLEFAKARYLERFFDSRPVEQEKLDKILEAARVVPTACNYQPQKLYLIRSEEGLARCDDRGWSCCRSGCGSYKGCVRKCGCRRCTG